VSDTLLDFAGNLGGAEALPQSGQIASRATGGARHPQPGFVSLLRGSRRAEFLAVCGAWFFGMAYFWDWWLNPAHVVDVATFAAVSLVLAWITVEPGYLLLMFAGAKRPAGALKLPAGSRVAMVVTKAPSEPFGIVAETLSAMLRQDCPHDTWLADEDPSPETLSWCASRGVKVSTRRGREDYHRATWPRRTRCKEGNLAFFYDHFGYALYDFVVQLDADHVPDPSYLREMLRPFSDPGVGYVSAPSICDKNAGESWSARGRLYAEANLHGPLQAGYNGGWAPICFGSHYAVRTAALKQIGGLGPELAEDHSTTMMMNAHGWRGVHAMDAIAHGDGPRTFADMVTQEFQWSRSLFTVLLRYSPQYLGRLSSKLKFQFLFCQMWYPLFALVSALIFALPIFALATGSKLVNADYPHFALHFAPISLVLLLMTYRWRAGGLLRPNGAKPMSWEGIMFRYARWPWALAGTIAAIRDRIAGSPVEFRVTPKGSDASGPLPLRVLMPYVVLSAASGLAVLLVPDAGDASGFYVFALLNSALYASLLLIIVVAHVRENGIPVLRRSMITLAHALMALLLLMPTIAGAAIRGPYGLEAITWGNGWLSLTREEYAISGAGQMGGRIVKLALQWSRSGELAGSE
jgi:cellulose synthase (UDP-forming)